MLRATRRLLREGGRTAFTVIHVAPDLSPAERRRASTAGPSFVRTRSPSYVHLLRSAGFVEIERVDVTAAYERLLRRWLRHAVDRQEELAAAEPPGVFAQRVADQTAALAAVHDGLLQRSLLSARRAV